MQNFLSKCVESREYVKIVFTEVRLYFKRAAVRVYIYIYMPSYVIWKLKSKYTHRRARMGLTQLAAVKSHLRDIDAFADNQLALVHFFFLVRQGTEIAGIGIARSLSLPFSHIDAIP